MTKPTTVTHFAALDALRGIAAVMVAWFHSSFIHTARPAYVAPGNIYVDFFFILSGFVLAHAYLNRIGQTLTWGGFFWLRLARLWPLHLFMTLLFVIYGAGQNWLMALGFGNGANPQDTGWTLICNILLIHSLGVLDGPSWNYPSWSISVEFYTGLIFLFVALKLGRERLWPWLLGALMAYAALIVIVIAEDKATLLLTYDFGIIRCIGGVFVGVALNRAVLLIQWPEPGAKSTCLQFFVLALVLILLPFSAQSRLAQALTIAAFVPLIGVLAMTRGPVTRMLSVRPFTWLGKISYSIYLTHALILSVLGFAIRHALHLPVSIAENGRQTVNTLWATPINLTLLLCIIFAASLSYRWIERPAQKLLLTWSHGQQKPARC